MGGGPRSSGGGMSGSRTGMGATTGSEEESPWDMKVEIQGIIYIFNPPDRSKFDMGSAGQADGAAPAAAPAKAAPSASAPGAAPAENPETPGSAEPAPAPGAKTAPEAKTAEAAEE